MPLQSLARFEVLLLRQISGLLSPDSFCHIPHRIFYALLATINTETAGKVFFSYER
jgi:hypothetical protein